MRGFKEGREAHAMATLISMPDQMAALTPSTRDVSAKVILERNLPDGSGEMEISYKLLRRMTLVTQTLCFVSRILVDQPGNVQGAESKHKHQTNLLLRGQL